MYNIKINSSIKNYNVNFYNTISDLIDSVSGGNLLYIIDDNVNIHYESHFKNKQKLIIPASEYSKTLDYISSIYNYLIDNNFKTDTHLVIIGGGILQDLGGFVASTFCRGVKYTLIPTTLLAQCDSCIGGKTSINHNSRKNILGTFYPPVEIKICTKFLNTLSDFDLKSGYGELIKFYLLDDNLDQLDLNKIDQSIIYGLNKKSKIIEKDEFDLGERKLLNFGHSFGHALESISNYKIPHGSAIIIGMMIANEVSYEMGEVKSTFINHIQSLLIPHIKHIKLKDKWFDFPKLLSYLKSDKKNTEGNINMVLINSHGKYNVKAIEDLNILKISVKKIYETIRLCN
jgi:3-dehydroquinate synthase